MDKEKPDNIHTFSQDNLYVAKLMNVEGYDTENCDLSFERFCIVTKEDLKEGKIVTLTGEEFDVLNSSNLEVGKQGFLGKGVTPFSQFFQKSYEKNPALKDKILTFEDLEKLEEKLTNDYIKTHTVAPKTRGNDYLSK